MSSWAVVGRLGVRALLQNCRPYSRKAGRVPARIQNATEMSEGPRDSTTTPGPSLSEEEGVERQERAQLPPGFPPFHKKGKDDSDLSRFALDCSGSKKRDKSELIMLEGKRLIQEAFDAKLQPKGLFFSRLQDVTSMQLPPLTCIFQKVTYDRLQRWSKVTTTSGLIGFFKMPDTTKFQSTTTLPFSIICDNVRDPGNLGSILRIAASAGCKKVFLTRGCVDLWNNKVLRAAMGSHFHMCIEANVHWAAIKDQVEPDAAFMFADNHYPESSEYSEVVRDDIFHESTLRNGTNEDINSNAKLDCADDLPTFPYYKVAYSQMSNLYLVVGGETEGLSKNAISFKESHKCFRVTIPMLNNVESLNVSNALAILSHEIKRQFELYGDSNQVKPVNVASTII